jgi:DNA repair protein RecO (recombination protein O)
MSEFAAHLQPAFVLHAKNYSESSVILDVLTEDYGRIALLAKGARKRKRPGGSFLQPFIPLLLSFSGRRELKILTHSEPSRHVAPLHGMAVYCGFYINELVLHLLYRDDPHPEVYRDYARCLLVLTECDQSGMENALRNFEINLLRHTGYGLQLDYAFDTGAAVEAEKRYSFQADRGAYEDVNGKFSGKTLLAVQKNDLAGVDRAEIKKLMRLAINWHMPRQLQSRTLIARIFRDTLRLPAYAADGHSQN